MAAEHHRAQSPPVTLPLNASGPLDPNDYMPAFYSPTASELDHGTTAGATAGMGHRIPVQPGAPTTRSFTPSPTPQHPLNSARSNPMLLPSRPPGTVRNMASKFDRSAASENGGLPRLAVIPSRDRYMRPATASRNTGRRSPTSTASGAETRRLQKRRPGTRSPTKSASMSLENSSFSSSSATTIKSTRSQPHAAFHPKRPKSPSKQRQLSSRPLFGEITADGMWNGNFDLGNYGPLPTFEKAPRRGSEGSLALGHGRSQLHQDKLAAPTRYKLSHKRSRSEMDAFAPQMPPSMPDLHAQSMLHLYPTPPDSGTRAARQREPLTASRIPIISRRQSSDSNASSATYSRPGTAMSGRGRLARSPTRTPLVKGTENGNPTSRSRYHPPAIITSQSGQTLSAKIVAPLPKMSPPLRSSRPRQPVSSATTSASRARAAERFQGSSANPRDRRRPSEQWLGKPYDPQKERSRRKIPELDKINFEERRARIQHAISQSLKSSQSQDSMRSQSRSRSRGVSSRTPSRITSHDYSHATSGADTGKAHHDHEEEISQSEVNTTPPTGSKPVGRHDGHSRVLSVETAAFAEVIGADQEPSTAQTDQTMFDEDESPILGRPAAAPAPNSPKPATEELPILLTSATYQPRPKAATALPLIEVLPEAPADKVQSPSVLDNVMRMRERSASSTSRAGTEFADDTPSVVDSLNDLDDRWGASSAFGGDQGSIRIMLDDDPSIAQNSGPWSTSVEHNFEEVQQHNHTEDEDFLHYQDRNQEAFAANGYIESPVEEEPRLSEQSPENTPRKSLARDDTLKPTIYHNPAVDKDNDTLQSDGTISQVLDYYQSTGSLTAEMIEQMQHHMVDLHRISANGGSDAGMIQNLLESIIDTQPPDEVHRKQLLEPNTYDIPMVTPDTPPLDGQFEPGTVIVYGNDAHPDNEDFEARIRKADEEWERQQRGEITYANGDEQKPPPPPKDYGYTPRSSTGPNSAALAPNLLEAGLRISTSGQLDLADIQAAGERASLSLPHRLTISGPPLPLHAPPPPPPELASRAPFNLPDLTAAQVYSERGSSDMSPRFLTHNWAPSGSSRPSVDSQRVTPQLAGSQSMTSFADSTRQTSMDTGTDSVSRLVKTVSPGPEQKRLMKRRHIIKELLDTENSYHQDLKIIEDIYKATCTPELVPPEDKKVLFGNCDEVEKFALVFYDEMRKAATHVYVPPKQHRWMNKRGSFSTTQSDGTTQTSVVEAVDDEKDRTTSIGRAFLGNVTRMEQVYGAYLKNHEAANRRLAAIQGTNTVKCWLDECHANASDITSAWDLDSLLVKPTQRVAKYPMLLQQLLETTPSDHPDHEDLKTAAKDSISMLTRINEAKKRADLVDQIINPGNNKRRKDSDVRNGIAKAFGRRTEKLKERVGIAEAFQDPDFDELAHKFGGHFIRLQICMRDVQDYLHRTDKATDLVNNYANTLELFTDVSPSTLPEIESKWRKYGQVIRDLTLVAMGEHKADIQKRVLAPMIQCIKLHEGPQNAINKRKKRMVDYARCKSDERRGQKPDKKTIEASDMYVALNDQLKLDLPKLYNLTAQLVQNCLHCFLDIQLKWQSTWERKLRPLLDPSDVPDSFQQIEPAFSPDFTEVEKKLQCLSICNGTLKIEAASFLSPQATNAETSEQSSRKRRPSTMESSNRTHSVGSEASIAPNTRRHSGMYTPESSEPALNDGRIRSNSSMSAKKPPSQIPGSAASAIRPWSNSNAMTPTSSFSSSRPTTANNNFPRLSFDNQRNPRPASDATYFTARPELLDTYRYSGLFSSAMPPELGGTQPPASPSRAAPEETKAMFVCASLFEFSIDKTRKEGGYPYLQYVQGEVFDVVGQKGELWLAKNQDDPANELGWIWEQHFIILDQGDN